MPSNTERRRAQLEAELQKQRAACKAALAMINAARERMRAPRIQMAAGYDTLRECRARMREIRAELATLKVSR
jgi:hypothetical protein